MAREAYVSYMEGKIFFWQQKAATINKNMADLSEQLQEIIVSLTIKNEQSVERNNNDICNHWLYALLYLKYFVLAFAHFRTFWNNLCTITCY